MAGVEFKPLSAFDKKAVDDLSRVGPIEVYTEDQETGFAALFAVLLNGERVGSMLLNLDTREDDTLELIVEAAVSNADVPILMEGRSLVTRYARENGIKTICCYTERPGIARLFMNAGARACLRWGVEDE